MNKFNDMLDIIYEIVLHAGEAVLFAILIFVFPLWIIPYAIIKRFKK